MSDTTRITEPEIDRDAKGHITSVMFKFGPHYFVHVRREKGSIVFRCGATHHGIAADAAEVNGELEKMIEELKRSHPDNAF